MAEWGVWLIITLDNAESVLWVANVLYIYIDWGFCKFDLVGGWFG